MRGALTGGGASGLEGASCMEVEGGSPGPGGGVVDHQSQGWSNRVWRGCGMRGT